MPQIIEVPDIGEFEFPDDYTDDQIRAKLMPEIGRIRSAGKSPVKAPETQVANLPPTATESSVVRRGGDVGLSLLQGVVAVPEAGIGLANLTSGGWVGKLAELSGVKFKETREAIESAKSPEQQEANRKVREAKGFVNTVQTAIENPSTILGTVAESAPSMIGSAGIARGAIMPLARRFAPVVTETLGKFAPAIAGAIGEGLFTAGSTAEQVRQSNESGLLTPKQSAIAAGSGATTALIGVLGGRLAKRLGVGDVDTLLAGGASDATKKTILRKVADGALSAGVEGLEELGQSAQEMAAQNVALGKPWKEGVAEAAAMGMFAGLVMGGATGFVPPSGGQSLTYDPQVDAIARRLKDPQFAQRSYGPVRAPEMPVVLGPENQRVDLANVVEETDPATLQRVAETAKTLPVAPLAPVLDVNLAENEIARKLVESGQVADSDFTVQGIKRAMGVPEDKWEAAIAPMVDAGLIIRTPEGFYRFNDSIIQKATPKQVSPPAPVDTVVAPSLRDSQGPESLINFSEVGAIPTPASTLPPAPIAAEIPTAQEAVGKLPVASASVAASKPPELMTPEESAEFGERVLHAWRNTKTSDVFSGTKDQTHTEVAASLPAGTITSQKIRSGEIELGFLRPNGEFVTERDYDNSSKGLLVGLNGNKKGHEAVIRKAVDEKSPISSKSVDTYGIKIPKGYVLEGDNYIFKPAAVPPVAATEVKAVAPKGETAKEPWQLTRSEAVDNRSIEYDVETGWNVGLKYLDNPAGPTRGKHTLWQTDKPVKGENSYGPFGRAIITTVTKAEPRRVIRHGSEFAQRDVLYREHKASIEQAIKEGKPVPESVLKDYPDLQDAKYERELEQWKKDNLKAGLLSTDERVQLNEYRISKNSGNLDKLSQLLFDNLEARDKAEPKGGVRYSINTEDGEFQASAVVPKGMMPNRLGVHIARQKEKTPEGDYIIKGGWSRTKEGAEESLTNSLAAKLAEISGSNQEAYQKDFANHEATAEPIRSTIGEQIKQRRIGLLNQAIADRQASGHPAIWIDDQVITEQGKYTVKDDGKLSKVQDLSVKGFEKNLTDVGSGEGEGRFWGANKAAKERLSNLTAERDKKAAEEASKKATAQAALDEQNRNRSAYEQEVSAVELPKGKKQLVTIPVKEQGKDGTRQEEMTVYGNWAIRKNTSGSERSGYKYFITHVPTGLGLGSDMKIGTLKEAQDLIRALIHSGVDASKKTFSNEETGKLLEARKAFWDDRSKTPDSWLKSQKSKPIEKPPVGKVSNLAEVSDEVTWKTGAGDMARATVQRISKLPFDAEPMADVDWFGVKRVPVSQLDIVKKSSRRIAEEARLTPPKPTVRESKGDSIDSRYPKVSDTSDGRVIRKDVPNTASIESSLNDYEIVPGIRDIPMSELTLSGRHYSVQGQKRIDQLADQIKESGEINPLIVVLDNEGLYILEGATRAEALFKLGAKSFPAKLVIDLESIGSKSIGAVVGSPISEQAATQAVMKALGVKTLPVNIRFTNNAEDPAGRVNFLEGFLPQIELNLMKIGSVKDVEQILYEELIHPMQLDPELKPLFDAVNALVTAEDIQRQIADKYSPDVSGEEAVNEMTRLLADRNVFQRLIDWIVRKVKERFKISLNKTEVGRAAARVLLQQAVKNQAAKGAGERFAGGPGVKTKVFDDYFTVPDRMQLTPELHEAASKYAKELLAEAGFKDLESVGLMWKLKPDAEQNQGFDGPGTFDHELEAKNLVKILKRELEKGRPTSTLLPHFLDSIRTQLVGDHVTSISRETRDELISFAQGEVSLKGLELGMHAANAPTVSHVGRNVGQVLQQVYADRFGGDRIRNILREAVEVFRSFLSPDQIKTALDGHPNAIDILNQIFTLNLQDTSNRIARRVDARMKKKRNLTLEQKERTAMEDEAVEAIIEQAKLDTIDPVTGEVRPGIQEPPKQKDRTLTPDDRLGLMTRPETQAKIQLAIETAIQSKEIEAGIKATIDAEPDPIVRAEMRLDPELIDPTPEMIEAGMRRPECAHWRKVRHDLLNYSPTTIKLVQDVIKARIKGTRFAAANPKVEDVRIDLDKLAKSPDAEVERVIAGQLAALEAVMDVNKATPATKARILETLRREIESQVEQARARIRQPLFVAPIIKDVPLTPEQKIRQLLNAKLFTDPNLDIPAMVQRLASKSALRNLAPKVSELIEQVFTTPYSKQSELSDRFADTLVDQLGVSPEQRARAKEVFAATFNKVFKQASEKASEKFLDSLTPQEKRSRNESPKSAWRIVEKGVNAGAFNASEAMEQIADANNWKRLTPEIAAQMRGWVDQMQKLREVPEAWLAPAKGDTTEIARLKVKWEYSHRQEMVELKRQIETMWSRLSVPLNIKTGTPNVVQAAYEWSSAVLLLKFGFPTRQFIDVFFQGLIHGPTRSMQLAWDNVTRNVANKKPREVWAEISSAFVGGAKVQMKSYRQALASVHAGLKGTPRTRGVDDLISRVALFDRATQKMEEFWKEGKDVHATILWLFTQVRWGRQLAAAMDSLSSIPATLQEMRQQAIATLRDNGFDRARADVLADSLMGDVQADWMNAIETARAIAVSEGKTPTEPQLKQSAVDIVEGMIYQRMREASLPADSFEERNAINKEVWGWNRKEEGGPGGLVAAPLRYVSNLGEKFWPAAIFGVTIGRFLNAIANSANIAASFTPLGYYPDLFGVHVSGGNKNVDDRGDLIEGSPGSNWFRTAEDRVQRKVWATIGSSLGAVAIGMVALGLISVRWAPPKDPKEREEWFKLHRARTVEFNLPDGSFIPVSLTVGPLKALAPYFVGAGAWKEKADGVVRRQEALNAEALKLGVQPGTAKGLDFTDYLAIAGQAAWGAMVGGRTASGMVGSLTDYGIPNVSKLAGSPISAMLPPLPAYQEIMRATGVYLDPKTATFFDYLVPTPFSSGAAVNMLGDSVSSDSALRRVVQIATGGSYPFPVSDTEARSSVAYASLFATEVRPKAISATKGYDFNGTLRPMTREELANYALTRGTNLKQELMALGPVDGMTPEDAKTAVQTAIKSADQKALAAMGVSVAATRQPSGGYTRRSSSFGRRTRQIRPSRSRRYGAGRIKRFRLPKFTGSRSRRRALTRTKSRSLVR